MRMTRCVVAVVAAMFVGAANADEVNLRIVADPGSSSSVSVCGGSGLVTVRIQAEVIADGGGAPSLEGLAFITVNVVKGGALAGDVDLDPAAGELLFLPGPLMTNFDRNFGMTNPPGPPASYTGYSGTLDGSGNLIQVGGGQNTIGNTDPPVYPVGPVDIGVGNAGYVDVAVADFVFSPGGIGTVTLTLNAPSANILADTGPAPFAIEAASEVNLTNATLMIHASGLPNCADHDVNCDGSTNSQDIGVIRAIANFNKAVCDANPSERPLEPRADVNRDGSVNSQDIGVVRAVANFNTGTGPCCCTQHPDLPCP